VAASQTTQLAVAAREVSNSRETRRLRRAGSVPGIVYGGGSDPQAIAVEERALRLALAHAGAVLELSIDGADATPVVLKDAQHHPVDGETLHIDFLRVRLDRAIQAMVPLELFGIEDSPGVDEGGVLEQITRELSVEALPTEIPDAIRHDVSALELNDTLTLEAITAPAGVTLLDDLQETVIATLSVPRLAPEPEEIEEETELVGEDGEPLAEGEAPPEGEEGGGPAEAKSDGEGGGDGGGDSSSEG